MFELIRAHQLNIMLVLCGVCAMMVFLLSITRFLAKPRKAILIFMELTALCLLWFDRKAYIYSGSQDTIGFWMVRISNFMVFFLTPSVLLGLTLYIIDWMKNEGKEKRIPYRLKVCGSMAVLGMLMAVLSAFTNLYYYFDESNRYHRGDLFLLAYVIPLICPIIIFSVLFQYRKVFTKLIYRTLLIYLFVPLAMGTLQIFTYGISIVNISMVVVSILLYICTYLDINNTVSEAHEIQIRDMQGRQRQMYHIFDQTATAFVFAVEQKDKYSKGSALKTAQYAKKIAEMAGKSEEEGYMVYYAALLHDIGLVGIPDEILKNNADLKQRDMEIMRRKPVIGNEILSSITDYPFLSQAALYCHEKYDGTGYPEGLKGNDIPEVARIVAVANTYVSMTSRKRYRGAIPVYMVKETFVEGSGVDFDPVFADIMVKIIDSENSEATWLKDPDLESEISCDEYRENVSAGISVESAEKKITFDCENVPEVSFSAPSIVLFYADDSRVHDTEKTVNGYHYTEYGEIWFDKNSITTCARKIEEKALSETTESGYEIIACRFEDHVKLIMKSPSLSKEAIIALPGGSKKVCIGLTGENCRITNIKVEPTGKTVVREDIPRIAKPVNFLDHLESDIKNIQINRFRSAHTAGIEINGKFTLAFHTMSLPGADLAWNCPYIVIFSSKNGLVGGENYREYAFITLNGESDARDEHALNKFTVKRKDSFPGWNKWKELNSIGLDCEITVEKKGEHVFVKTENLGVSIENTTTVDDKDTKLYLTLTGDQIALTDIRFVE